MQTLPEFRATNPDGSDPGVEFTSWTLTQYLDKYHVFEGTVPDYVPLLAGGWLDIYFGGEVIFRGYLESIEGSDDGQIRCTYYDIRKSFEDIYAQLIEYPAGYTVNEILSSDPPTQGKKPGLLWLLNSAVPQGAFEHYSGEIYVLRGAGTNSRCGTADVYQESTKLVLGSGRDTLQRGQYWRDQNDLYVRCTDGRDPKYWLMSIAYYRDTRIRLGVIQNGSTTFSVPYRVKKAPYRDAIEPLLNAMGLEMYLEHRAPAGENSLGLSYLHASETVGRGSPSEPIAYYGQESLSGGAILVTERTTGQEEYAAVIGEGPGRGYTQVTAARANFCYRGQWRETIYSTSLLGELLERSLERIWRDQSDSRCWEVEDLDDLSRRPGDYVEIRPPRSGTLVKRIKKIVHRSNGTMTLEINQRRLDPEDLMRVRAQLIDDMMSYVQNQVTTWSTSFGPSNVDDSDPGTQIWSGAAKFEINVPVSTIDRSFPYRFMLSFTIGPYEETTESSHTPAHSHSGRAGTHSGYGGTQTSWASQHQHTTPATTVGITGFVQTVVKSIALWEAGGHTHNLTIHPAGGHKHDVSVFGNHVHSVSCTEQEFTVVIGQAGAHTHYVSNAGTHSHEIYGNNHTHGLTIDDAGGHSHSENTDGSHSHSISDDFWIDYTGAAAGHEHQYYYYVLIGLGNAGGHAHTISSEGSHNHQSYVGTIYHSHTEENTGLHMHILESAGDHEHSGTLRTVASHCHTVTEAGGHLHSLDNMGDHTHTYDLPVAGGHTHPGSVSTISVADAAHDHAIPELTVSYGGGEPHTTQHESANEREIFTEPISEAIMTSFKKLLDTGNSTHLLDVSVKINGIHVPGSPFPGLYIGDSEEVDVSSLVQDGKNIIEISIKEHYDPAIPVRCSVRGSLSAVYYIYPFAQ